MFPVRIYFWACGFLELAQPKEKRSFVHGCVFIPDAKRMSKNRHLPTPLSENTSKITCQAQKQGNQHKTKDIHIAKEFYLIK
jgi:hypothetical protein